MNGIANIIATGGTGTSMTADAVFVMSASQRVLAMQGIRVSSQISDLGLQGFATKAQAASHIVIEQDKPVGGWHPAVAYAATEVFAVETGDNPADLRPVNRHRTTHPATVNTRSRHRSRHR
ncbi:hypothetical protein [Nocardia jejuensis]|uniref:hypothetical protein n=1 Tax=Nocardia jejuensis TaxID=328049 RepID=UPI00082AF1E5|nr:hypothetical protein [Nocardia jejuensis]